MIVQNGINILTGFLFKIYNGHHLNYKGDVIDMNTIPAYWNFLSLNQSLAKTVSVDDISTQSNNNANTTGAPHLYFGTGTTPVTKDDYTLGNFIQITTAPPIISTNAEGTITTVSQTITNSDDDTKTITELGLFMYLENVGYNVMMARELLKTPIVLNSGDSKVVTFGIDITNVSTKVN